MRLGRAASTLRCAAGVGYISRCMRFAVRSMGGAMGFTMRSAVRSMGGAVGFTMRSAVRPMGGAVRFTMQSTMSAVRINMTAVVRITTHSAHMAAMRFH